MGQFVFVGDTRAGALESVFVPCPQPDLFRGLRWDSLKEALQYLKKPT
jgi:hypothetical protein